MRRLLLGLCLLPLLAGPADAGTIVIVNNDSANEGFNDTTAVAPVGGNPGTTLGAQRLNVFQHAANVWGSILPDVVTIRVSSQFNNLSCTMTAATLGQAGPLEVFRDFAGAGYAATWYHVALANKRAGFDMSGANDISATFNSALDNATCLGATGWYYGYDSMEGTNIELLPVVLHELGHGLGFSTLVNLNTGAEFDDGIAGPLPDIYERFIYDLSAGNSWPNLTPGQRAASAINTGRVVWNGQATRLAAQNFLGPTPSMQVNSGAGLPSTIQIGTASFGPGLTTGGITGNVVLVNDGVGTTTDGCEAILNSISGRIALIDRGTCNFSAKTANAEAAGAIAVIIADNVAGSTPPGLGGTGSVNIPTVSVTQSDGTAIKNALLSGTVNVKLFLDPSRLAGADQVGRVQLYAPNPLASGSSISHFDITASPNLLMEPFINASLTDDVDLTRYLFADEGWLDEYLAAPEGGAKPTRLLAAVPNPFRSQTMLSFDLPVAGPVKLDVYDLSGRLVRTLAEGTLPAQRHNVAWDGKDAAGRTVASGIYLTRLVTQEHVHTNRVVLIP